jgi:hypothetical protein
VVQVFTNALLTLPAKMRGMGAIRRGAFEESEQKEFLGKIMYAKVRQANEHTAACESLTGSFVLQSPRIPGSPAFMHVEHLMIA